MEEFKNWLLQNWSLLSSVLLFIVAAIISLIRSKDKKATFLELVNGLILEQLPSWISEAEAIGGKGESKRVYVLNKALNYSAKKLGRNLTQEESDTLIAYSSENIESILLTPQKKAECLRGKKK